MPPCSHPGCPVKYGEWGYSRDDPVRTCAKHREQDMVKMCVSRHICKMEGCTQRPSYKVEGSPGLHYCTKHAPETGRIPYLSCIHEGCNTRPIYGVGTKPTHCLKHKTEDMDRCSRKPCSIDGCPSMGVKRDGNGALFCCKHYSDMELRVCKYPGCTSIATCTQRGYKRPTHCEEHLPASVPLRSRVSGEKIEKMQEEVSSRHDNNA